MPVQAAKYDETCGLWSVSTVKTGYPKGLDVPEAEYICRWLIVATGENTVPVIPDITGKENFNGEIIQACSYKMERAKKGKMWLSLDAATVG